MNILKIRVNWNSKWSNSPKLEALVDKIPTGAELRYAKSMGRYFAEKDGYVSYFAYDGQPGNGFGGQHFPVTMVDGSRETLVGPWSSRTECMNEIGFTASVECDLTTDPEAFERGYTFQAGAITVFAATEALEQHEPGVKLARVGDQYYPHSREGCRKVELNECRYECPVCGARAHYSR